MNACFNLAKAFLALRVRNPGPDFFGYTASFLDLAVLDFLVKSTALSLPPLLTPSLIVLLLPVDINLLAKGLLTMVLNIEIIGAAILLDLWMNCR